MKLILIDGVTKYAYKIDNYVLERIMQGTSKKRDSDERTLFEKKSI